MTWSQRLEPARLGPHGHEADAIPLHGHVNHQGRIRLYFEKWKSFVHGGIVGFVGMVKLCW